MRILVVDDDLAVRRSIDRALRLEGYEVVTVSSGGEALETLAQASPDALILDLQLPDVDGLQVCRQMRSAGDDTPVLMLTARQEIDDRVQGLDAGADDYLTKPFALDVLLARVRAAARRVAERPPETLRLGDLSLHPQTYALHRGERVEQLTRTEYALLETLMRRNGNIVPREVLISEGWGIAADVSVDSLYVFIRSLRSKITHPGEPKLLHTVRGVGYALRSESR